MPGVEEESPVPHSELSYFPNHLAYRPSSFAPTPARLVSDAPETLDQLSGEHVDVLTIIRMPGQSWPEDREVNESEEVVKEWGGMEMGIVKLQVNGAKPVAQ